MRKFVLMRSPDYARGVAKSIKAVVRSTDSELLGVIPQEGDCFIIDLHFKGMYVDLEGLKNIHKLIDFISDCSIQIELWSWLPEHYIRNNYNVPYSQTKHTVIFKQFPY